MVGDADRLRAARHQAILLPGAVLPAALAYEGLLGALAGADVDAIAKNLEVYAAAQPPPDYSLELEVEGALRAAEAAGFERFHAVGYSAGGASVAALAAGHPDRVRSLALLEPAWIGDDGRGPAEDRVWRELQRIGSAPPDQMLPRFVRAQLADGVDPPPPPAGPPPPWMALRPAGIRAVMAAFERHPLDADGLRGFGGPVLFVLGGRSNPDLYRELAARAERRFGDFTLEVFEDRHHFDPPHRAEPERLARSLRRLWERAA